MTESLQVRPATAADAPAIQRVARRSWHAAYDDIIGTETVATTVETWFAPEKVVSDDVEPDERPLFVAEAGEGVVGFAEAVPDDDPATYHLYRIYVDPDAWGEGVGTALFDRVEATVRERGATRLELSVFAANGGAIAFYEARGCRRVDEVYDDQFDAPRYTYEKQL
ncbi:N-acetyltransferase family protein [Halobacteriales archaeon Cl-PHB]